MKKSDVTKALIKKCSKAKFYYDKNAHSLRDLRINQFVRVQPLNSRQLWKLEKVVLQYVPCSYVVKVDGKLITRIRKFLRTTFESPIVMPEFDISTNSDNNYSLIKIVMSMHLISACYHRKVNLVLRNILVLELLDLLDIKIM